MHKVQDVAQWSLTESTAVNSVPSIAGLSEAADGPFNISRVYSTTLLMLDNRS